MKTNLLLITVLLFAISCAKEPSAENNQSGADVEYTSMTFKATAEDVTKVLLQNDRVSLHWQAADRIKVFDGVSNDLPAFAASGSGAQVDFHGQVVNSEGPFYALYPYQNDARMEEGILYANVPEIQHAVAGSVPSNAFVAAAKAKADGTLHFRTLLCFIRFTLNDERAADIESITLSGNDDEALSGLIKITFDNDGNPVDTYTETMSRTVTLVGNFISGEDYMFAIRLQAFAKGMTLSILYNDGTRRYISSDYRPLDGSGAHISMTRSLVMNFGTIYSSAMNDTTPPPDRYVAYMHGYDLVIAGETYNIRTHGKPILLKSKENTPKDIKSSIHEKSGVFFIDSSLAEVVLNSIPNITGDLVALIGRYEDKPNVFTPKYYAKIASDKFVMMDLDIDTQYVKNEKNERSQYVFTLTDGPGALEAFHIDGCKIKNLRRRLLVYDENNTRKIKGLRLVNSDIEIEANPNYNTMQIFYLQQYKDLHTIKEITFDNNIVYHNYTPSSSMATTCRVVDVPESGYKADEQWDAVVSICNNTIYNLPSPWAYFNYYKVASLVMTKNISAVSDSYDAYSGCMCLFRGEQSGDVINISDNVYYGLTDQVWFVASDTKSLWIPAYNVMTQYESAVNPFKTIDCDEGIFVPLDQYATYGAQR